MHHAYSSCVGCKRARLRIFLAQMVYSFILATKFLCPRERLSCQPANITSHPPIVRFDASGDDRRSETLLAERTKGRKKKKTTKFSHPSNWTLNSYVTMQPSVPIRSFHHRSASMLY